MLCSVLNWKGYRSFVSKKYPYNDGSHQCVLIDMKIVGIHEEIVWIQNEENGNIGIGFMEKGGIYYLELSARWSTTSDDQPEVSL